MMKPPAHFDSALGASGGTLLPAVTMTEHDLRTRVESLRLLVLMWRTVDAAYYEGLAKVQTGLVETSEENAHTLDELKHLRDRCTTQLLQLTGQGSPPVAAALAEAVVGSYDAVSALTAQWSVELQNRLTEKAHEVQTAAYVLDLTSIHASFRSDAFAAIEQIFRSVDSPIVAASDAQLKLVH
jgi:hypothetical protein